MKHDSPWPWLETLLAPNALLAGVVVAFLGCCAAGHRAASRNYLESFARFHVMIAPDSYFYPTIRQVRQVARATLDPAKIAVVIGGSSIMHGTGQPVEK